MQARVAERSQEVVAEGNLPGDLHTGVAQGSLVGIQEDTRLADNPRVDSLGVLSQVAVSEGLAGVPVGEVVVVELVGVEKESVGKELVGFECVVEH